MKSIIRLIIVLISVVLLTDAFAADRVTVIPLNSMKKLKNVVTVSAKGGDFSDPVAAVNSIKDKASANNPFLVLIGPGVYILNHTLNMKPYVSIAGSGQETTILKGEIGIDADDATPAIILGANNSTLHDLSVVNTGGGTLSIAIYNYFSSPVIHDVSAAASGGTEKNYGVYNHYSSSSVMKNMTITASGGNESYGVYNHFSPVKMNGVTTEASAADYSYGVYNSLSQALMTEVTASASGGYLSYSYGVYNNNSTPKMIDVTAKATGETTNYGVYNNSSSPEMTGVTTSASGGLANMGVENISSSPVIRHSTLDSLHVNGGTTRIVQSAITGTVNKISGTLTCVNSVNGDGEMLDSDCAVLP